MTESALHLRVFFAIDLSETALKRVSEIILQLQNVFPEKNIRWAKPSDLHVTLQFQKAIDAIDVARVVNKVHTAIAGFSPFELNLGPLMWFPEEDKRRLIVLGTQPEDELKALANRVGEGLVEAGYELRERNFRGHLSLCRLNLASTDRRPLPELPLSIPPIKVKQVILFRSEHTPLGPFYTILERFHSANI